MAYAMHWNRCMHDITNTLALTAVTIGFLHTAAGPDHYVPFVAMARIGRWSIAKSIVITLLCGVGHVLSSAILGFVGIAIGLSLDHMNNVESARGDIAGWMLTAFGLVYMVWGLRAAIRNRPHTHVHVHDDGTMHAHEHVHTHEHTHVHATATSAGVSNATKKTKTESMTPWILFTIFIFGPCEALIPMVMVPAAQGSMWGVFWVTLLFGAATLLTMTAIVVTLLSGVEKIRMGPLERFSQAIAGAVVLSCGLAIQMGL